MELGGIIPHQRSLTGVGKEKVLVPGPLSGSTTALTEIPTPSLVPLLLNHPRLPVIMMALENHLVMRMSLD